jgi:hypothetical protein
MIILRAGLRHRYQPTEALARDPVISADIDAKRRLWSYIADVVDEWPETKSKGELRAVYRDACRRAVTRRALQEVASRIVVATGTMAIIGTIATTLAVLAPLSSTALSVAIVCALASLTLGVHSFSQACWLSNAAVAITALQIAVGVFAHWRAAGSEQFFSSIVPDSAADETALIVSTSALSLLYVTAIWKVIRRLQLRAWTEQLLVDGALDVLASVVGYVGAVRSKGDRAAPALGQGRPIFPALGEKQVMLTKIRYLSSLLLSPAVIDRIGDARGPGRDLPAARLWSCAARLAELRTWIALPQLRTLELLCLECARVAAPLTLGYFHYLPTAEVISPPRTTLAAQITAAVMRLGIGIAPIGLLLTSNALGLRFPDPVGIPAYLLAILWFVYLGSQAVGLDPGAFASFAAETAGAVKGMPGGKADGKS